MSDLEVDNYDALRTHVLSAPAHPLAFWCVILLRRAKDNPDMPPNSVDAVLRLELADWNDFLHTKERVVAACRFHRARAYVRVNRRNRAGVSQALVSEALAAHFAAQFDRQRKLYDHVVGVTPASRDWVAVDVDDPASTDAVVATIHQLQLSHRAKPGMVLQIPSRSGHHLVAPPFALDHFKAVHPAVGVNKDGDVLLWCPAFLPTPSPFPHDNGSFAPHPGASAHAGGGI